ncbi:hypothetical protein ACFXPA_23745 [Amycolatopsis sp. NPDC059090]|uniref:hypothetical protein n=1 Tax=unclassified Amycolatopsis TaxID=2618356 RepID=UPI00366F4686
MGRKKAAEAVAVGAVVAAALALAAGQASADHYHTFTQDNTTFDATDANGRFTGQAVTFPGRAVPMAWSFRISPAVQAIAVSSMNCTAGHMQLPYHDAHSNIPVDYFWHSTVQGNKSDNTPYDLYGSCVFKVKNNGTANLKFTFHYLMLCGPCGPRPEASPEQRLSTRLDIDYRR